MGCDIHSFAEVRKDGKWQYTGNVFRDDEMMRKYSKKYKTDEVFLYRNYGLFGFLADVRNYSCVESFEAKGWPTDSEYFDVINPNQDCDFHTYSYLTLEELLDFDYSKEFEDQRSRVKSAISYKEFLGEFYFQRLEELKKLGNPSDVRVVFWFDN